MIIKTIPSTWIIEEEHRLDCGPFVKGSVEARKTIEALPCPKNHLVDVTKGGINGMYHVGQDKIIWVDDEEHGLPFVRSSDILKLDLSNQPRISRRQVAAHCLSQCTEGTTLITRSGTIGRMAYMRSDMVDTAISTKEEVKMGNERKKIMGKDSIRVPATTVRVPVIGGHSESVNIEFENDIDLNEVRDLLAHADGVTVVDDVKNNQYPMPIMAQDKDDTFVGRLRRDETQPNTLNCWIVSDNLRKGAATNAVQIAEYLMANKLI